MRVTLIKPSRDRPRHGFPSGVVTIIPFALIEEVVRREFRIFFASFLPHRPRPKRSRVMGVTSSSF